MPKPYSDDVRSRVVEAIEEGATREEAAEQFGVSLSTVGRSPRVTIHESTDRVCFEAGDDEPGKRPLVRRIARKPEPLSRWLEDVVRLPAGIVDRAGPDQAAPVPDPMHPHRNAVRGLARRHSFLASPHGSFRSARCHRA
jgi:hypothetical protein